MGLDGETGEGNAGHAAGCGIHVLNVDLSRQKGHSGAIDVERVGTEGCIGQSTDTGNVDLHFLCNGGGEVRYSRGSGLFVQQRIAL